MDRNKPLSSANGEQPAGASSAAGEATLLKDPFTWRAPPVSSNHRLSDEASAILLFPLIASSLNMPLIEAYFKRGAA
jgi:hypothetical protein